MFGKRLLNNRGFSIVGVLVAAGMMGGLALILANMTRQQQVAQKKAETGTELTGLYHKILSVLYDGDACTKTLGPGSFLPFSGTSQTRSLTQLKNRGGTVVVKTGPDGDINRMLRVESMTLKNVKGNIGLTREADLEFVIKRLGRANAGHTTVKKFPITVELRSLPNIIERCHHTLDSKEQGIKERMCTEMGGVMLPVPGTSVSMCSIGNLMKEFCESLQGVYTHPGGGNGLTYVPGRPIGTCNIADRYVDAAGDIMTGPLVAPSGSKFKGNLSCQNLSCSGSATFGGTVSAEGGGGIPNE